MVAAVAKQTASCTKVGRALRKWGAAAILAAAICAPANAHKTYLASERQIWREGETIQVSLTSALAFPDIQFGVTADRVAFAVAMVGGEGVSTLSYAETETALNIHFAPERIGFAVLATSTHPRSGEISPGDVDMYFEELDADPAVQQAFHALPGEQTLMRSYSKHTKTFFCVATCEAGAESAAEAVGQPLEFTAVAGEPDSFALVREGERLPHHRVAIHAADGSHSNTVTDANGEFALGAGLSGDILLSAVWIDVPSAPDGVYHSDQATLTLRLR